MLRVYGFNAMLKKDFTMNITLEKLKGSQCRWPIGNPEDKDFSFCGHTSDPAVPYCEEHMLKAHVPARKPAAVKAA
jgi:GcrA cell cycle regulator